MRTAALIMLLMLAACGSPEPVKGAGEMPPGQAATLIRPLAAPAIFRSVDKSLTFPTPPGSTYCPLPDDWIGSDHGTTVFLTPPARCGGGAYPSSERGALNAPNIQIYYGYDVVDEAYKSPPPPCQEIGRIKALGRDRPLCVTRRGAQVEVRVETSYSAEGADADIDSEAVFTLVTDSNRLDVDLETFRTLVSATGACNRTDIDDGPRYPNGRPDCDADAVFF